jgi:foldase protein PrsA
MAVLALAAVCLLWGAQAEGQLFGRNRSKDSVPKATPAADQPAEKDKDRVVKLVPVEVPVNPTDPVAIVNREVITRQQLADEAVARKGKEVLEAMIAGMLIDQAVAARKLEITPQEVEDEIDSIARGMGTTKQNWLRTLDKERGISPLQYKRDIIYRLLALRKLAEPRVQVTDEDLKKAYEANYGEKLHYRIIMTATLQDAKAIWNELKGNPAAFERIARDDRRSIDTETKPIGGLALQPMARHAFPLNLSQAAFEQLVDGHPDDKDPEHKPKDGDITGPIQIAESSWVILRRERVEPAKPYDPNNAEERERFRQLIFDVKLNDKMQGIFQELVQGASIENKLTGEVRMANEERHPAYRHDGDVKLMSNPPSSTQSAPVSEPPGQTTSSQGAGPLNLPRPANAPPTPKISEPPPPQP